VNPKGKRLLENEGSMVDNIKMDVNKRSSGQEQLVGSFKHDN